MNHEQDLGYTNSMGPRLRAEVERQLRADLKHYGVADEQLSIDWSDTVPEGHVTRYLDGELENWSGIVVRDQQGQCIAEGWLEFIHGAQEAPLLVFWDYLSILDGGVWRGAKTKHGIPHHIWQQLLKRSRDLCMTADRYDARWFNDPLVKEWRQQSKADG